MSFFLINKPKDITSFGTLKIVRKKLGIKKIGHTGTLDPFATGCLLVATENYTKLIPYLEHTQKEYTVTISLDGVTETYDNTAEIHYISDEQKDYFKKTLSQDVIHTLLKNNFSGEILQIPPRFSALKIDGQRAYDLARKGEDFEMKPRKTTIYTYEILSFSYPTIMIRFAVSAGTYIRSIAHDIGQKLGCGGYAIALNRTKIGTLDISESTPLEDVGKTHTLDIHRVFQKTSFIEVDKAILKKLKNGMVQETPLSLTEGENYFIEEAGFIVQVAQYQEKKLIPLRGI